MTTRIEVTSEVKLASAWMRLWRTSAITSCSASPI